MWWFIWAGLLTYYAVVVGLRDVGWEFAGAVTGALFSWVGLAITARGHAPPDFPT